MNIQGNLNQAISIAGLLAINNPELKKLGEKNRLNKQVNVIEKKLNAIGEVENGDTGATLSDIAQIAGEHADVRKQLFDLSPSGESYAAYQAALGGSKALSSASASYEKQMAQKAEESLIKKQEQRRKHRNFLEYMKDEPYTLGNFSGTIGQLNPEQQKVVSSSYSKAEKTKIMNEMDERRKNG